jgi:hypothetical protein
MPGELTMTTLPHIARAQAVRSVLEPVVPILESVGATVVLDTVEHPKHAATFMTVTFKGSLALAYQLAQRMERGARAQGVDLTGVVCDHDDLRPDQQRVGLVCLCPARKAA